MTDQKQERSFGTWPSLISPAQVAQGSRRFGCVQLFDGIVHWSESRPEEGGRSVIMRGTCQTDRETLLPAGYSAKSRIYEYGGGEFSVTDRGLFFVNDDDQDIYLIDAEKNITRVTDVPEMRFADFCWDSRHDRLIAVAEKYNPEVGHSGPLMSSSHPENLLVTISQPESSHDDKKSSHLWKVRSLVSGNDFYASPSISPDYRTLAWLSWNLPNMPWDGCELSIGHLDDAGNLKQVEYLAGSNDLSIFQPQWTQDGRLLFISDQSGWGNPYIYSSGNTSSLHSANCEYARPQWSLGMKSYSIGSDDLIVASSYENGNTRINVIDLKTNDIEHLDCNLRSFDMLSSWRNIFSGVGTTDSAPSAIVKMTLPKNNRSNPMIEVLREASESNSFSEEISKGQVIEFSGRDGQPVFGLYYSPANAHFKGPDVALPPVIINVHGGPTGIADRGFKIKTQYWTSRGFGLFDIDYSGSFGYGRAYRKRLDGCWGVRDIEDVLAGVEVLVRRGLADPDKIVISGGSAGGFTVLMALAQSDVFAAGASYYGVCDLQQLLNITHKFESGYLFGLLGVKPGNIDPVFRDRSPLFLAQDMSSPTILFQGLKDRVVPAEQSRSMVRSLVKNKIPTAYLEFADEGHGFRQAETIIKTLSLEYAFYARHLELDIGQSFHEIDQLMHETRGRFE